MHYPFTGDARTVMFTLPGQSVTPIMLPLLQAAFPEDRHVFVYQGCVASVRRAMALRKQFRRATVPTSLEEAVSFSGKPASADPIRFTTPLRSALTKSVYGLTNALAALRLYHADTVESWMASVDTFFKLKDEEATNGYLPYTLKLGLLIGDPHGSLEPDSDRFYSFSSLMQFITGCRSRPLPEGVLDAAREWLRDFALQQQHDNNSNTIRLSDGERAAVENCVFGHKSILIEDKTLKDTVLPTKHWTLKQTVKRGCSCCAPEEEDEDEDSANGGNNTMMFAVGNSRDDSRSGATSKLNDNTSNYVDGKTTFAFDPSNFSSPSRSKYVDGKTSFAFDPTKFS